MLNIFLLQDAATSASNQGWSTMLLFVGMLAIFYFFLIRPQQKRQKEEKKFREALQKGDRVLTIGGIYGQVESLDDNTALVSVDQNVKIRFDKSSLRPVPEPDKK